MAYTTPVTDRTAADIVAKNSKAYFNVADWTRVYNNSQLVNSLVTVMLDERITFDTLTAPTIATIPTVTDFNTMIANIERTRFEVAANTPIVAVEIKDDWAAGFNQDAPDYIDANLWESTLDAIWDYYSGDSIEVCPTLTGNLTVLTGASAIYVDCLDTANYIVDLQGTAVLHII